MAQNRIMTIWLCVGLLLSIELVQSGLIFNLEIGEICLQSLQCKSKCCQRERILSFARCAPKATERSQCSRKTIYGVYYRCPCEDGLVCGMDITTGKSNTNTDFGYCRDPELNA